MKKILVLVSFFLLVAQTSFATNACTTQYDPVCGKNSKTYSNECVAKNSNIEVAHKGECLNAIVCTAEKECSIKIGQTFSITLESNPSTGYVWKFSNDGKIVKSDSENFASSCEQKETTDTTTGQPATGTLVGCGGKQTYNFTAIAAGSVDIAFENISPSQVVSKTVVYKISVSANDTTTTAPTVVNSDDKDIKTWINQLKTFLVNQKKNKGTHLGFVSSAAGKTLTAKINKIGDGIVIVTAKNSFCAMKKLSDNSFYCIDSNGFAGTSNTCNKKNISCTASTTTTDTQTLDKIDYNKFTKEQLIAIIMNLIKKQKLNTTSNTGE